MAMRLMERDKFTQLAEGDLMEVNHVTGTVSFFREGERLYFLDTSEQFPRQDDKYFLRQGTASASTLPIIDGLRVAELIAAASGFELKLELHDSSESCTYRFTNQISGFH